MILFYNQKEILVNNSPAPFVLLIIQFFYAAFFKIWAAMLVKCRVTAADESMAAKSIITV